MDSLLDFTEKTALITGAASGFGEALALALATRGAKLCLADFNAEGLADTVKQVEALGGEVVSLVGDIADEAHNEALVLLAKERFGRLDIAVNNAGVAPRLGPMTQLDGPTLDRQLAVNAKGVAFGMKHQMRAMGAQKNGAILNVSSMAGLGGTPMGSSYCAAKHALEAITESLYFELQNENIDAVIFQASPMLMERSTPGGSPRAVKNLTPGSLTIKAVEKVRSSNLTSKLTPEAVAEKVYEVVSSTSKPLRTRIGLTKIIHIMTRIVPRFVINKIVEKEFSDNALKKFKHS